MLYFAVNDCQKRFFAVFLCEEHDKIADRVTASIMGMMILVLFMLIIINPKKALLLSWGLLFRDVHHHHQFILYLVGYIDSAED